MPTVRRPWPLVQAFVLILTAGLGPACSCNGSTAGSGDGGGSSSSDGGGGGGGGDGGTGGVTPCTGQGPSCQSPCFGPTCMPPTVLPLPSEDPNFNTDGTNRNPKGEIILDQANVKFDFLWIANDTNWGAGTVSKISTKPRATPYPNGQVYGEVARYPSVTCLSDKTRGSREGQTFGAQSSQTLCADGMNGCCARSESSPGPNGGHQAVNLRNNRPSRTSVDFNGDVWVANRAFDRQGSVTKIANSLADCVDRNGVPGIQTSSDVNQDGIITTDCDGNNSPDDASTVCTNGRAHEFYGLDDECVLFTTNVGAVDAYVRPLALGPSSSNRAFAASDAWPGTWKDGKFFRVDGTTGLITQTVTIQSQDGVSPRPYGAAIDKFGVLWAPNLGNAEALFYFNTNMPTQQGMVRANLGGGGFYGIAIDGFTANNQDIQQVWMGEFQGSGAYRYRPNRANGFAGLGMGTWARASFPNGTTQGRGIAVDNRTPVSFVWVALDGGAIGRIPFDIANGDQTIAATNVFPTRQGGTLGAGVAIDLDVWGVNQGPSTVTHFKVDAAGNVSNAANPDQVALDDRPGSAESSCAAPVGGGGGQCKPHPYTYSDFTGFGLRNFTNPRGSYTAIIPGCGPGQGRFRTVLWDADLPVGTAIQLRARSADSVAGLNAAPWTGLYQMSPADLSAAPGPLAPNPAGFLQVEFILTTTAKGTTPALRSFTVVHDCEGAIG